MWRLGRGDHSWTNRRVDRVLGWVAWVKALQEGDRSGNTEGSKKEMSKYSALEEVNNSGFTAPSLYCKEVK